MLMWNLWDMFSIAGLSNSNGDAGPDLNHEMFRRKVENGITEFWFYLRSELGKIKDSHKDNQGTVMKIGQILENGLDHQQWVVF